MEKKVIDNLIMNTITNDDLIFKLPLYKKLEIDWMEMTEKTEKNEDYDQNWYSEEYVTYCSNDYEKLIMFISNKNGSKIYGKCPSCKKDVSFALNAPSVDKDLINTEVLRYNDLQLESDEFNIADVKECMKSKIYKLLYNHTKSGYFEKNIRCDYCQEIYKIYFKITFDEDKDKLFLQKVGQYPSINEFSEFNINKSEKLLKKINALDDFRKGCCAEGYGLNIGSYTYFRRVLEKYIYYKFDEIKNELNCEHDEFTKLRMDEKLALLKEYLPEFLFQNKVIYQVVSAGIHFLDEFECEKYSEAIKSAINIILLQEEINKEKDKIEKETIKEIQKANYEITKK